MNKLYVVQQAVRSVSFAATFLIVSALSAGVSLAANVSVQLEGGDFGCCVNADSPFVVARTLDNGVTGDRVGSAFAEAGSGTVRAEAYTNAWVDPGTSALRLSNAQTRATLDIRLTNIDAGNPYVLESGDLGLTFDATYMRDLTNIGNGSNQFQLRMDASVFDAAGSLQSVNRAWANHIVTFDSTSISDNVPTATSPFFTLEQGAGVADVTASFDDIAGQLSMDSLTLEAGGYINLSLLLFVSATATLDNDPPVTDIALFPSVGTDASNTVQLYFNNRGGIEFDTQTPPTWPTEPNVIPIPASAWLFMSAVGVLGWFRRRSITRI